MSLNLSASAVGNSSHLSHTAAFSEDGPGCGTRTPGWHPPVPLPHLQESMLNLGRFNQVAINPQPLPPREDAGTNWADRAGQLASPSIAALAAGGQSDVTKRGIIIVGG